jgi:hypothetical protein
MFYFARVSHLSCSLLIYVPFRVCLLFFALLFSVSHVPNGSPSGLVTRGVRAVLISFALLRVQSSWRCHVPEQPGGRHCMNIIECVVFSVRLSSDTPFCSSVPTVRESRSNDAPSGERNSLRKVLSSTSALISPGVVIAASVEFGSIDS